MNVKRIGSALMVGLVLLSAMVVLTGTVAATSWWPVQFEGTIEGVAENTVVNIERTVSDGRGYTYTQMWNGSTDSKGYFITEPAAAFSDKDYTPKNAEPEYTTSAYYQLYIGEVPDERKFIGVSGGPEYYDSPPEVRQASGFVYHGPGDCYYIYNWEKHGEIPEFSTIVIPIASILGLLFFFNRRKHRKE